TGTLLVTRDGKEYEKDLTGEEITVGALLGIEDFGDFLAYERESAKGLSLEEFEKKEAEKLEKKHQEEEKTKTDILTVVPGIKEVGADPTPAPAKKSSAAKSTPAPTPAPVIPVIPDNGDYSYWEEPSYSEPSYDPGPSDPGPSYDPGPAPATPPVVEETVGEGSLGGEESPFLYD
ncbi:MAG: hypothetical protein HUJ75_05770, partial [Parasporobacterium sp.]|nr:hypothetical protein [Parasporobacterium sp.]